MSLFYTKNGAYLGKRFWDGAWRLLKIALPQRITIFAKLARFFCEPKYIFRRGIPWFEGTSVPYRWNADDWRDYWSEFWPARVLVWYRGIRQGMRDMRHKLKFGWWPQPIAPRLTIVQKKWTLGRESRSMAGIRGQTAKGGRGAESSGPHDTEPQRPGSHVHDPPWVLGKRPAVLQRFSSATVFNVLCAPAWRTWTSGRRTHVSYSKARETKLVYGWCLVAHCSGCREEEE